MALLIHTDMFRQDESNIYSLIEYISLIDAPIQM